VQTFDESVATGVIPKGMIVDELHILGMVHYAARVLGQLWGGLVSKPDGFLFMITTQSDRPPAGVFKAELNLARAIRDGRITGPAAVTLPVLYEFPEEFQADKDQPWRDSACWPMVLPNLGRSVQLDLLQEQYAEAAEKGDVELARWASQHLNIEIGIGMHADGWRGAELWEQSAEPGLTLDAVLERSEVVVVGIDGGGLDDLFGLAVLGREKDTGNWLGWFHAYAAASVLELRKDVAPALQDFVAAGDLTLFTRGQELTDAVLWVLGDIRASGKLPESDAIGIDPQTIGVVIDALAAADFALDNAETGKRGLQVLVPQGWALSSAVWSIEFKLYDGAMIHSGSGLMNWCVGNAKVEQRGNAVFVSKAVSGKAKIDPLVALFNAAKLMERNPQAATIHVSPYASRPMVIV
jgi:phage terminase large subunit-like protein